MKSANTYGGIIINPSSYIKNNKLKILVKPSSPKNEIVSYNEEKQVLRVNIKAQPEKGKANKEVINFFSKLLKKQVTIIKGKTSKHKILKIS
ncbi:MAG: DUF167 domain-containing protein [Candidatus Woesearchaeota archaeon]